jgi:hypothetical protein
MVRATHLLKAYYLKNFERKYAKYDFVNDDDALIISDEIMNVCCLVVQGSKFQIRKKSEEDEAKVQRQSDLKKVKLQLKAEQKAIEKQMKAEEKAKALLDKPKSMKKKQKEKVVESVVPKVEQEDKSRKDIKTENDVYRSALYNELHVLYGNKKIIKNDMSLSYILAYSVEQFQTAIENNIWMRFPSYVKKYIYCYLLKEYFEEHGELDERNFIKAPSRKTVDLRKKAALITNKILYNFDFPQGVDYDISQFVGLVPKLVGPNRLYDLKVRPNVYLQRMFWFNRMFETSQFRLINPALRKLLSPLPLVSQMIPSHIRLDTSGMAQLLMNQQRIREFVAYYEIEYNIKLNMSNKGDLLSSYSKLTGIQNPSVLDQAMYATRFWKYICNFHTFGTILTQKRNTAGTWVFDNAIVTDGVSVSFQITKEANFKRKIKTEKVKKVDETKKKEEFLHISDNEVWNETHKQISNDPGKADIACFSDGIKTLCYTKGTRNQSTCKRAREIDALRIRKKIIVEGTFVVKNDDGENVKIKNPSIHDYETKCMSETCKKSCFSENFGKYCERKEVVSNAAHSAYRKKFYRQCKFLVYCKTKSSEHKFFNKAQEVFGCSNADKIPKWMDTDKGDFVEYIKANALKGDAPLPIVSRAKRKKKKKPKRTYDQSRKIKKKSQKKNKLLLDEVRENNKLRNIIAREPEQKQNTKIMIGWGNWGANPNLKGNAPTPGIGFKRRAQKHFMIATTPEHWTSQTCPCCQTMTLENPEVGKTHVEKHHLLRCTNEHCQCRYWNRNVVGSFNILRNVFEAKKQSVEDLKTFDIGETLNLLCPNTNLGAL